MKIYQTIAKGALHEVFCEDFLLTVQRGNYCIAAVFDGCSGGQDSHFASTLMAKLLRKAIINRDENGLLAQNPHPSELCKMLIGDIFGGLKFSREYLKVSKNELLATILIFVYDIISQEGFIQVIGDGVVTIDGKIHEIDQHNQPDYIAYHLDKKFSEYYENLGQYFELTTPQDVSISTDGITTFRSLKNDLPENFNPIDFLLKDEQLINSPSMLKRKMNILNKRYGMLPGDDVCLIRILF